MNTSPQAQAQERLSATFGALVFFVPFFMTRTEFTVFYMRQGFMLFVAHLVLSLISLFMPVGILFLFSLIHLLLAVLAIFLAFKAYNGEKFAVPHMYEASVSLLKSLGLDKYFAPSK